MLQRLIARLRPAPLASREALRTFLQERASLIAQKCAIDYCRGKTGLASYALFTEKPFLEALDLCHWESFVAVLADLLIVTEGHLRPHALPEGQGRLRDGLLALYREALESLPLPAHRPQGWHDAIEALRSRLASAAAAAPRQTVEIADHSARRLFETLPIHSSMRELDEEVVFGAVRFRMIAVNQEMQRRLAAAEVARQLAG